MMDIVDAVLSWLVPGGLSSIAVSSCIIKFHKEWLAVVPVNYSVIECDVDMMRYSLCVELTCCVFDVA